MSDDMPEQKKTVELEAVPPWAIELTRATKDGFLRLDAHVATLMGESSSLHARVGLIEGRLAKVETPSVVPPAPITSVRVESHPSQMDLEQQAKLAANIVKTGELEAAIHDTKALAESAVELGTKANETLQKQSDFMGMGKKGIEWLRSKEARADIVRFITLVGVGYAALKSAGVIK